MKQILLTLLLGLFSMTAFSQLVIENTQIEGDSRSNRLTLYFTVHNTGTDAESYFWDIDRMASFPAEWEISVCDCFTCYDWGQETALCDEACQIEPQDSFVFTVYVNPNGVDADGELSFKLLQSCGDDSTQKASNTLTYLVSTSSSTSSVDDSNIVIYPNPAFNSFQIADDEGIENIVIYNIVGKQMIAERHKTGQRHDVTDLEKGIYLVRMMDKTNEVVKVVRLTKE